jgi:hypothetical protein
MIDSVAIVAIIAGCSALIVAVLTHLKHSTCNKQGFEITTTESHTPVVTTEEHFNYGNMIESITDRPPSPAILKVPEPSEPIPIPKAETPLLLRKNYL